MDREGGNPGVKGWDRSLRLAREEKVGSRIPNVAGTGRKTFCNFANIFQ